MKAMTLFTGTALALAGWFFLTPASLVKGASLPGDQMAQYERREVQQGRDWDRDQNAKDDEWYQGQRGHWDRGRNHRWEWRGAQGDEWYQGQRGHWYKESNGWQFGSDGLLCDYHGRNCRRGGYLPPNGQGMVNPQNPNLYWACDSDGHHCHWARRSRF